MKSLFYIILFFITSEMVVFGEETTKEESKPSVSEPLKYESGTITVDPRAVSIDLKKNNLQILRRLKSSLLNIGLNEEYKKLMKSYIDANILLRKRKYKDSRRAFESNYSELNQAAKTVLDTNKESYQGLFRDVSETVIEKKIEAPPRDRFVARLEKNASIATDISMQAEKAEKQNNYIEAIKNYQIAKFRLIEILQMIYKKENESLTTIEKAKKKLFIEDDYIPEKYLKDYDDSQGFIHELREQERKKEREYIKKGIRAKYGKLDFLEPDEKETPATDVEPDKPAAPGSRESDEPGGI